MKRFALVFALLIFFGGIESFAKEIKITILHTNDVHGHAWARKDRDGTVRGGFPAQAELVKKIRKEVTSAGGGVLLLSAGDINTGVPESDLLDARPDLEAMNWIGYDAMVLGNHEFDRGTDKIVRQTGWAKFPFLSANVYYKKNKKRLAKPYLITKRAGLKIGVVGLTTGDLKTLVNPQFVNHLDVVDPIKSARRMVPEMRKKGAELIIALTHMGLNGKFAKSLFSSPTDDRKLARKVSEIDAIIGGHTDTLLRAGVVENDTLIAQAGGHGDHLGRVDLVWDTKSKKLLRAKATVIEVKPENGEDKKLKALLTDYKKKASKSLMTKIGETEVFLEGTREKVRQSETNLGNFICDALRKAAGTDVAIYNSGGIRSSIEKGKITIGDIYHVLPFSNTMVSATVTGRQLRKLIEHGLRNRFPAGAFLQVSGIKFTAKGNKVIDLEVGGKKVKSSQKITLATNDFILQGGDKFSLLTKAKNKRDSAIPVDRVVAEAIRKAKRIKPRVEGRINLVGIPAISE